MDSCLSDDVSGFPLVGPFPPSGPDTQPLKKTRRTPMTIMELCAGAPEKNREIIDSIRLSPHDDDLMTIAIEDAVIGV